MPAGRARLSAEQRRAQLTEIGLELLETRPIHELALDEVAAQAGISRTLLFHYFPNKSEFYAAVVERAGQRLLASRRNLDSNAALAAEPPEVRVRSLIDGYLRLVDSSRGVYVRLVRGAAGGDPEVLASIDKLRDALVPTWVAAAGWPAAAADDPLQSLLIKGWLVGLEEVAMSWDPDVLSREVVTQALVRSFLALANAEGPAAISETDAAGPS